MQWGEGALAVVREGSLDAGLRVQPLRVLLNDLVSNGLVAFAAYGQHRPVEDDRGRDLRLAAAKVRLICERLDQETRRIAALLSDAGVPTPIVLKGPAMARYYTDPRQRAYTDMDLLVPATQMVKATGVLERSGYRLVHRHLSELPFVSHEVKLFRGSQHETRLQCELHWCLFIQRTARSVGYEALVVDATPGMGGAVLFMAPPQQLLAMALHWAHHAPFERRLKWVRDFLELVDEDILTAALSLADEFGVRWTLERALADVERILGLRRWEIGTGSLLPRGLPRAIRQGRGPSVRVIMQARELGPIMGARFISRLVGPSRFRGPEGGVDWPAYARWIGEKIRARKPPRSRD